MISKGQLMYRDFAVQHGPFSYLLLVPFSFDKSLLTLKTFYILVQTANLFLLLLILKKSTSKLGLLIGGVIFTFLNFYLSDNNLWDEIYATSFFLLAFYLSGTEKIRRSLKLQILGLLMGLTTLMKPSFGIMIVPIILFYRTFLPLIPMILLWLFVVTFYFFNNGLYQFIDNYILLNKFYITQPGGFWLERSFFNFTMTVYIFSLLVNLLIKKKGWNDRLTLTVFFTVSSLLLFYPGFHKTSFYAFSTFLNILIAQLIGRIKKPLLFFYLVVVLFYGVFGLRKAKHQYVYLDSNRTPYSENKTVSLIVEELKKLPIEKKRLYVLGNQTEIYFLLDKPAQVYFPFVFPFVKTYFKTVEARLTKDLARNKVDTVIIPKPLDPNYRSFSRLKNHITTNFRLIKSTKSFDLYKK
ncbi:hypothetical protein A2768_00110 [Candidatus Roizmanbacteria bacterium RIFCSPHIGHO2_01_FULL_37_16]|nr:MAG: hypothetical protein A2768_00110 [Candidatus Roizmanbacteria bacterium RIFCSPHIGHO2_01_FULL_37_16]